MKILHIIDDLEMGGGQNLLIGLVGTQRKLGHDVVVLQLVRSADKTVADKIETAGVGVKWIKESGSLYSPLLIIKLIPWINDADIVHVHLFPALYWAGFASLVGFCKTPLVYTEHSTKNRRRANPILRRVDAFVYKHCYQKVIACSDKALETLVVAYPKVGHVCAVNNGVDTNLFREAIPYTKKELWGIPENCFVITMVARFMFMKRQDIIVEALSKLPEKFHACFVGGEPEDEGLLRVKDQAERLGLDRRVHFMYIRPDVPRILKSSDVVVMASEYEGLSLSSIEGMAAGRPFVASDVDGLKEIVGGAGLLFDLLESQSLASIVMNLDDDRDYYDNVSRRCEERALEYDVKVMTNKYLSLYKEVIDN